MHAIQYESNNGMKRFWIQPVCKCDEMFLMLPIARSSDDIGIVFVQFEMNDDGAKRKTRSVWKVVDNYCESLYDNDPSVINAFCT